MRPGRVPNPPGCGTPRCCACWCLVHGRERDERGLHARGPGAGAQGRREGRALAENARGWRRGSRRLSQVFAKVLSPDVPRAAGVAQLETLETMKGARGVVARAARHVVVDRVRGRGQAAPGRRPAARRNTSHAGRCAARGRRPPDHRRRADRVSRPVRGEGDRPVRLEATPGQTGGARPSARRGCGPR